MKILRPALLLTALLLVAPAWALEYLSVANSAVMYDTPSIKGTPLYIVKAGTPVEVIVSLDGFVKVRDMQGTLAWIEKSQLSPKRTLLVKSDRAPVRADADDAAPLLFEAGNGVVLELAGPAMNGWVGVKHRDGQSGFIRTQHVLGL